MIHDIKNTIVASVALGVIGVLLFVYGEGLWWLGFVFVLLAILVMVAEFKPRNKK